MLLLATIGPPLCIVTITREIPASSVTVFIPWIKTHPAEVMVTLKENKYNQ